jgi:hypothetical protein
MLSHAAYRRGYPLTVRESDPDPGSVRAHPLRSMTLERKHRTAMSPAEIEYSETLVHGITEWNLMTHHAAERMEQKHIAKQSVVDTLKYGAVIEVNSLGRILIRLMKGKMKGTCVVVSPKDKSVVTVWYNRGNDNHATVDMSQYGWDVDVITFLRRAQ